ncbi:MAG: transposase [bacterium]|nr:transposase [bacterium]
MATHRATVFAVGQTYHVFNKGIDGRTTFGEYKEYTRAVQLLFFYHFSDLPLRYSHFLKLPDDATSKILTQCREKQTPVVSLLAYCLMPNHFHLLVHQAMEHGVSQFLAYFQNSYTKYFNTKTQRSGPLFQGPFKAVRVETDDQLLHVSRYIHLNPVTAYLVKIDKLDTYAWSSWSEYMGSNKEGFCDTEPVLSHFLSVEHYRQFTLDHASYARELKKVKRLALE